MKRRLISSLVLLLIGGGCLASYRFCGMVVTLFIIAGLYEFYRMIEKKGVKLFKIFGSVIGTLIPISIFFRFPVTEEWQFLLVVVGLFGLFLLELMRKENYQTVLSLSATVFGIIYISWCFSFLIRIRQTEHGVLLMAFLILVTKATDIGAYLIGSRFGRTSLLPRVSPKKSLEGAAGGFVTGIIGAGLFSFFLRTEIPFSHTLLLGALLAILGQLGDLFESLIKRDCEVKDSGRIIPGMGGVLDFLDSLIFTAPTFYLYITMMRQIFFRVS